MRTLLVCSYLEGEHIERIQQVSTELQVHYRPDLIPAPRYTADHTGASFVRTAEQDREWYELMRGTEILFDFDYTAPERMVEHATSVRWIQASSAGIGQFVKRHRLDRLGAVLTTAAGIHARPLAEFVVWSALAFAKNYPLARKQQRDHLWQRFHNDDLEGKTLAVIGLGRIGREVAALARAVGLRAIGSKRTIEGIDAEALGVERLYAMSDLHAVLREADYVCLICPHTAETEGLMDHAAFDAMKPGSVLINIGRGALVREDALLHALRHGPMAGAVLDVAPQEPLPAGHPLWDMENVILFPHSASTSKGENDRLVRLFTDNLGRYLEGRPLRNVFDFERMY
jgi:phosphoglycerate dehydrogenase-like enzyme